MLDTLPIFSTVAFNATVLVATETSFLLSIALVLALKHLALHHGVLLDKPCAHRKFHHGAIPLVGGLAVFLAVGFSVLASAAPSPGWAALSAAGGLLVLGGLDDSVDIPAKTKLLWQVLIVTAAVLMSGIPIPELWAGQATHPILYGAALALVVTGIAGYLNAVNMVDGADGLAGGVMLTTALYLAVACAYTGDASHAALLLMLAGGMMGFLLFNFRRPGLTRAKVFMGDAGTLSLGFLLAWCATALAVKNTPAVLWLMAYPALDLASVVMRRMKAGGSPFRADRGHLHHRLLDAGLPHSKMLAVVLGVNATLGLVGVFGVLSLIPGWVLVSGFPLLIVMYLMMANSVSIKVHY